MQISKCHKELDENGVGKCSVPMWCCGMPAGFCDEPAYGKRVPTKWYRDANGRVFPADGRYEGYVPALACPSHGGPVSRVFMDGDQWCAVYPDFINIQESPAGFGYTQEEARLALSKEPR